jgi:hypothetical protein
LREQESRRATIFNRSPESFDTKNIERIGGSDSKPWGEEQLRCEGHKEQEIRRSSVLVRDDRTHVIPFVTLNHLFQLVIQITVMKKLLRFSRSI